MLQTALISVFASDPDGFLDGLLSASPNQTYRPRCVPSSSLVIEESQIQQAMCVLALGGAGKFMVVESLKRTYREGVVAGRYGGLISISQVRI